MNEKAILPSITRFRNFLFVILIACLLVSPMIFWLSMNGEWNENSILEERKLTVFPPVKWLDMRTAIKRIIQGLPNEAGEIFFNQFIVGKFQRKVDKAVAEQMPLRIPLVELAKLFERSVVKSAYLTLPDEAYPACLNTDLVITRDEGNLIRSVAPFTDKEKQAIDARIANYAEILRGLPQVNFYVFNIETIEYSPCHPLTRFFPQADAGRSLQYFLANKSRELRFENYAISSFEDFRGRFFKTDHHWTIRGALQAYERVHAMLREGYTDISPLLEVKEIKVVPGLRYLGSLARTTLYPIEADILEFAEFDLQKSSTYVNGEADDYGGREHYLQGVYNPEKYFNHYQGFFGGQRALVHYQFENDSARNLLMIASSHARVNQMLIASHFRNTYVVDLRFKNVQDLSIRKIVDEYAITDVLVMGQPSLSYAASDESLTP